MTWTSSRQFGLIIAYVLPGFIALAGIAPLLPAVARWLRPASQGELGIGPPLYAVLGATAIGLILSCFRWILLDDIHHRTGIVRPIWDDSQLQDVLGGFDYLVDSHYRYYQFSGNTLLAILGAYILNRSIGTWTFLGVGTDLGMVIIVVVLFAASRDALAKYYSRTGRLIGLIAEKASRGQTMHNGNDHGATSTSSKHASGPKPAEPKPPSNPQPSDPKENVAPK